MKKIMGIVLIAGFVLGAYFLANMSEQPEGSSDDTLVTQNSQRKSTRLSTGKSVRGSLGQKEIGRELDVKVEEPKCADLGDVIYVAGELWGDGPYVCESGLAQNVRSEYGNFVNPNGNTQPWIGTIDFKCTSGELVDGPCYATVAPISDMPGTCGNQNANEDGDDFEKVDQLCEHGVPVGVNEDGSYTHFVPEFPQGWVCVTSAGESSCSLGGSNDDTDGQGDDPIEDGEEEGDGNGGSNGGGDIEGEGEDTNTQESTGYIKYQCVNGIIIVHPTDQGYPGEDCTQEVLANLPPWGVCSLSEDLPSIEGSPCGE